MLEIFRWKIRIIIYRKDIFLMIILLECRGIRLREMLEVDDGIIEESVVNLVDRDRDL